MHRESPRDHCPGVTDVVPPCGVREARAWLGSGASSAQCVDLSGTWQFRYSAGPQAAGAHRRPATHGGAADGVAADAVWDSIEVPGHWQLQGYGAPAYTNVVFPIPVDPPRVPQANPTGTYRRQFDVPQRWLDTGRVVLRFEGVDSWFAVAVNGTSVATSSGSRLPTEIDVTDVVGAGPNTVSVRVSQWSAMTYIEDQDQWWLSGIFRPVTLLHRPFGGIDDLRVDADFDPGTGMGSLTVTAALTPQGRDGTDGAAPARLIVPELGIDTDCGSTVRVPVEPWSAEVPRLYGAQVVTAAESVALTIGFRRVSTTDGVLQVNGRPITLRGVNRHEFSPARGRAIGIAEMRADVELMKAHHINAVRTSHYPPHPDFLTLCDEVGLYVVDENDFETHGFEMVGWRGNPTDDQAWADVLVDRVRRMVARDAHHPSIIMWSLGNEAGTGRNLGAMAAAIRAMDGSRPLHYEGAIDCENVDVYSRMYASLEEVELIGQGVEPPLPDGGADARRRRLPFVLCEYAHAMGNGPGGLAHYDRLFDTYPRLAGGFIWEWIDHGIATTTADGTPFFGYGGDFGESLHDGAFVADGLLLPDRVPSPGLTEVAAVFAPIRCEPCAQPLGIALRNRFAFRAPRLRLAWQLLADGVVIADGELAEAIIEPGGEAFFAVPAAAIDAGSQAARDSQVWWHLVARSGDDERSGVAWCDAGQVLGSGEVLVRAAGAGDAAPAASAPPELTEDGWRVGAAEFDAAGRLRALGRLPIHALRMDAWRAPTDNDRGAASGVARPDAVSWQLDGLDRLVESVDEVRVDGDCLVIAARTAGAGVDRGFAVTYRWREVTGSAPQRAGAAERCADVEVEVDITPWGPWTGPLARLGIVIGVGDEAPGAATVSWVGTGPGESYPDSMAAVRHGRFSARVAELQTRYTRPQDNGARQGVRSAVLDLAEASVALQVCAVNVGGEPRDGVAMTVRPWSDHELDAAEHPHELNETSTLWLHLDAAIHGLGTAACGPGVPGDAVLRPAPASFRVRFSVSDPPAVPR